MAIAEHDFLNPKCQWFWWWRKPGPGFHFDEKTYKITLQKNLTAPWPENWKRSTELGAFRYELCRRHKRPNRSQPYPAADPFSRDVLGSIGLGRPLIFEDSSTTCTDNWIHLPAMHISPEASFRSVIAEFEKILRRETTKLGIERPKGPRKRHVPVSWRPVELLDRADIDLEKLNGSERSGASEAREAARKLFLEWLSLVKQYSSIINPD